MAFGWKAIGQLLGHANVEHLLIPLDAPSVVQAAVASETGLFHGPPSPSTVNSYFYKVMQCVEPAIVTVGVIHIGKRAVNGGITVFLCGTAGSPGPAGTPTCPQSGTVSRTVTAADILAPGTQGIEAGNYEELAAALRSGHAYANVHSSKWPSGEIRAQINDRSEGSD